MPVAGFCNNPPVLEARELECERGGRALFRNMNFSVESGELLRVAGPNGSGKSSLLRILCGLLAPVAGEVRWNGAPIRSLQEEYSGELVYLGHAAAVKDDLTAAENLDIACRLAGRGASADAIRAALARLEVPQGPMLRRLSQGQRRRAALARLVLSAAVPLWLLDEPFSALDARGIELLNELLAQRLSKGGMIVLTTHQDPAIAATRIVELG
jgi:heme exporter protein A